MLETACTRQEDTEKATFGAREATSDYIALTIGKLKLLAIVALGSESIALVLESIDSLPV